MRCARMSNKGWNLVRFLVVCLAGFLPAPQLHAADWNAAHVPDQLIVCVRKDQGAEDLWTTPPYNAVVVDSCGLPSTLQTRLFAAGAIDVAPLQTSAMIALASGTLSPEAAASLEAMQPERFILVRFEAGTNLEEAADSIAADTTTQFVEPDYLLSLEGVPNDTKFLQQWNLGPAASNGIDAAAAWDLQKGNSQIKIAILDTGADKDAYDLGDGQWGYAYSKISEFKDYLGGSTEPVDGHYHGTAVASVAAGLTNNGTSGANIAGVAGGWNNSATPNANANSGCKVFPMTIATAGDNPKISTAVNALTDAMNYYDPDVILLAWGVTGSSSTLQSQIEWVSHMRKVIVASKGNDNHDTDVYPHFPSDYQGGRWNISVGAIAPGGGRAIWTGHGSNYNGAMDVCAPGTEIWADTPSPATGAMLADNVAPGIAQLNGTSYAAAEVAGVAGLILSEARDQSVTLHPDDVQGLITSSATRDIYGGTYTGAFGWGAVNARRALDEMRPPWVINRFASVGGTSQGEPANWSSDRTWLYGAGHPVDGLYWYKEIAVRKTIPFSMRYLGTPYVWTRGTEASVGWRYFPNAIFGNGYSRVVSQTATSVTLETYVYKFLGGGGTLYGPLPVGPDDVVFAYTVLGIPADTTAPAVVSDLTVAARGRTSLRLEWTDTGDDGAVGTAAAYDLRYFTSPITSEAAFSVATPVETGIPGEAGSVGCAVVDGLQPSHTYYCALKVRDEAPNWSERSASISGMCLSSSHYEEVEMCAPLNRPNPVDPEGLGSPVQELRWSLGVPAPNPSSGATTINYSLKVPNHVRIDLYDVSGRKVRALVDGVQSAGGHSISWDGISDAGNRVKSGVYFCQMTAGGWTSHRRLVIVGNL